ncbi:MAG: AmmeMemoRadiSam system radical SAM enzyme, partial [Deltaproteobacteria bacterium]|nr:AmmeMemoRadiSam system radical SAM enzyme [Deltaproteobacteria bacterium]
GICGVRENRDGVLYTLVFDKVIAHHLDPVEKKPLFHFLPGSGSYSIATSGCNLKCSFCQNSDISQALVDQEILSGEKISPEDIVNEAIKVKAETIAYTYTEPTIFFELAKETAVIAASKGLRNIFISNGYMTEECIEELSGLLHGANIDLKAFSDDFYRKQCSARLEPVLNSIKKLAGMGVWIEITTLLIPGLNDSEEELTKLAEFIMRVSVDIPWHISRFHPAYRMNNISPTPLNSLIRAQQIGYSAGLRYVYTGNMPGDEGEKTCCHNCGNLLIDRYKFTVNFNNLKNGHCPRCKTYIPGVWS